METFGKASQRRLLDSATVAGVGRRVARASAVALLALGGFASSIYAARPARGVPSGPTTATTGDAGTTGATPSITVSTAPTVLAFSGHGYGHGLGMSQWGAAGYAGHGLAYDRILAHYYPGFFTRSLSSTISNIFQRSSTAPTPMKRSLPFYGGCPVDITTRISVVWQRFQQ